METPSTSAHTSRAAAICVFCLQVGCDRNILTEYLDSGQSEVYADMLRDTFNIEITKENTGTAEVPHICSECVAALRAARSFKRRVLASQRNFSQYWRLAEKKCIKITDPDYATAVAVAPEPPPVKTEVPDDDQYHFQDVEIIEPDDDDDEYLANIKQELASSRAPLTRSPPRAPRGRKRRRDACWTKTVLLGSGDDGLNSKTTDWMKIAERRGNGPLLRANTLTLLANSTVCVFQWNKSRYRCFCCKEPFSNMTSLREHTQAAHTLKTIEKKIILQQNRLVKVEVSSLQCKICSKPLTDLNMLKRHLVESHEVEFGLSKEDLLVPFKLETEDLQCQLCSEKFTLFRLLNIHMNKHYQKQVCHICGAGFSNLVFLNLHKTRSHKPLKCNECNLEFGSRSEKKDHDVHVHNVKLERKLRFPCPFCQERFFQENFKVQHLVEKHGMARPEHKCPVCLKVYITKSLCNNHVKNVHMKEKNRECDVCHMRFYTKSDVARHRVTHTGEKNFSCNLCNNLFASKDSLRRHLKRTHIMNSN
ncbi:hypothetical protein JYU34_017899 [Plutella xylostella]|uniref:Uncharacterized protein n=1 Tax=Plutella xylostella TaxID=51655 RepID=A0ABQ7PZ90_PLUXY|nr:hypothetical protein JYU34_017899 [Plutella xylostella]